MCWGFFSFQAVSGARRAVHIDLKDVGDFMVRVLSERNACFHWLRQEGSMAKSHGVARRNKTQKSLVRTAFTRAKPLVPFRAQACLEFACFAQDFVVRFFQAIQM